MSLFPEIRICGLKLLSKCWPIRSMKTLESVCYSTMNQIGRWHVIRHELAGGVIQPLDRVGGNPAPDVLLMDQH